VPKLLIYLFCCFRLKTNGNLEAEVLLKQLEVATLKSFQIRRRMEKEGINPAEMPPKFEPQDWEEIIADEYNSTASERLFVCFLLFMVSKKEKPIFIG